MSSIAFLGAGNIAQAIMGGLIENSFPVDQLAAYDPSDVCRERAASLGVRVAASNDEAIETSDIVILCVKPNVLVDLLHSINASWENKLVISVAAGITTAQIAGALPPGTAIIRCMPNTPALVQSGMTAMFANEQVSEPQRTAAAEVLGAVGEALWVNEEKALDAVTAVSGSGPAYFFLMMEAMIRAGEEQGLPAEVSEQLVLQTALGAARMAILDGAAPAVLRERVTSPGGTTQAAVEHFLGNGFQELVSGAVEAARIRSEELSRG